WRPQPKEPCSSCSPALFGANRRTKAMIPSGPAFGASASPQQHQHPVELVEAGVVQRYAAAAPLRRQRHPEAEGGGQIAFQRHGIGIAAALWPRCRLRSTPANQLLGSADVEAAPDDL